MSDPKSNVGSKKGQKIPWEELKFKWLKIENQAFSKCLICNSMLKNTCYDRLLAHRKICKPKDPLEVPPVPPLKRRKENPKSANKSDSSTSSNPSSGNLSVIDEALAKFFFGCNIPFSTVDSCHFRDFVHKLNNPNYKPPSRNSLSGSILDEFYMTTLKKNSSLIKNMMDGRTQVTMKNM